MTFKIITFFLLSIFLLGSVFAVYDTTIWPVATDDISSPFGPRLKASDDYRYDFHRGVDFPGVKGNPIYAVADADVYRVYLEGEKGNPYPNGGTVIILRHNLEERFLLGGEKHKRYYSLYMHLDDVNYDCFDISDVKDGYPYPKIKQGAIIGFLGSSGTTEYNHLHFETRVGTACSYASSCSHGFDPHVNPFYFLDYDDRNDYDLKVLWKYPLVVRVDSDNKELDLEQITVSSRGKLKTINFNTREGLDIVDLDNANYNDVRVYPLKFNKSSDKYSMIFVFSKISSFDYIEIEDIKGFKKRLE